jgi:anti-sigma-K factor RskA
VSHPYADDAGPWLLGALAQDEARAFSSHLESCELCRGEVARLQFVVDNLPLAAPLEAPPAALRARIMATVEAEAQLLQAAGTGADRPPRTAASTAPAGPLRRWFGAVRPLPAAALACALLLAGLGAGSVLSGDGSDVPRTRTVRARAEVPDATARLEVTGQTARLAVSRMPAPPKGRVYQVWLKRDGRTAEPTHTLFTVRRDGRTTVAIDEPLGDADELLVTAEPDGGSIIPTRQPVLRASL